jgi:hypothetical protein
VEITATTKGELERVNDLIHDRWFWLEDIIFDETASQLVVRFSRPSGGSSTQPLTREAPQQANTEWHLIIESVQEWSVRETEGIGEYDFNVLDYSESTRTITVSTGVPLEFRVQVLGLSVRVSDTGRNVRGERTRIGE